LKIACGQLPDSDQPLASQPTMCRFEYGLSRTDLYRIARAFLEVFIDSYDEPPEGIILDIDDTDDPTHNFLCSMPIMILAVTCRYISMKVKAVN